MNGLSNMEPSIPPSRSARRRVPPKRGSVSVPQTPVFDQPHSISIEPTLIKPIPSIVRSNLATSPISFPLREDELNTGPLVNINSKVENSDITESSNILNSDTFPRTELRTNLTSIPKNGSLYEPKDSMNDLGENSKSSTAEQPINNIREEPINNIREEPINNIREEPINNIREEPINNIREEPINNIREEPINNIEEPINNIEEPINNIEEPINNIEDPINNIEDPINNIEEPINNIREEPRNIREKSRNIREEPRNIREEPRNVREEPRNIREEPRNIREEPRNIREEPRNVREEPRNVREEPRNIREEQPKNNANNNIPPIVYPQVTPVGRISMYSQSTKEPSVREIIETVNDTINTRNNDPGPQMFSMNRQNETPKYLNISQRPLSPRDTTSFIINNQEVNRNEIQTLLPEEIKAPTVSSPQLKTSAEKFRIRPASPIRSVHASSPISSPRITLVNSQNNSGNNSGNNSQNLPQNLPQNLSQVNSQTSNQMNTQFNNQMNTQFNNQTNTQFNNQTNTQFNNQTNTQFNNQTNTQINNQMNTQLNSQTTNTQTNQTTNQENKQPNTQQNKQEQPNCKKQNIPPPYQPSYNREIPKQNMSWQQEFRSRKPNYKDLPPEDQARALVDFQIKFGALQRYFPQYNIKIPTENDDLDVLYAQYERYLQQTHVDQDVPQYKVALILLFIGIEWIGTKVFGLPISGYTISQMKSMHRYERLLMELGEKQYTSFGSGWPVEIRILMIALLNAAFFVILQYASSSLGQGAVTIIQDFLSNIFSGAPASSNPSDIGASGVPPPVGSAPTTSGSGFDFGSLLSGLGTMFGGQHASSSVPSAPRPRAPRKPRFEE